MLISLKLAIQFLTRIPLSVESPVDDRSLGRALLFYPVVGAIFSVVLVSLVILLQRFAVDSLSITQGFMLSAIVLVVWVFLSGALHLDGLGDSADAWLGGGNDPERTLAIMKDTHAGTAAVVTLVLLLLLKFSALQHLIINQSYVAILLAPLWARTTMLLLFATTSYIRPEGLGALFSQHCSKPELLSVCALTALVIIWSVGWSAVVMLSVALIVFGLCRQLMLKRIAGTTGDTAGALVELTETAILVAGVFLPRGF